MVQDGSGDYDMDAKEFSAHTDKVVFIRRVPAWISTEELGRQVDGRCRLMSMGWITWHFDILLQGTRTNNIGHPTFFFRPRREGVY